MEPKQILSVRINLKIMTLKEYSTLRRFLQLLSHPQIKFGVIPRTPPHFFYSFAGYTNHSKFR